MGLLTKIINSLFNKNSGPMTTYRGAYGSYNYKIPEPQRRLEAIKSWAWICIDGNASTLANAFLNLYVPESENIQRTRFRKLDSNKLKSMDLGDDYVLITDPNHPVPALFNHPNGIINNSFEFLYTIYCYLQITGEVFVEKLRDSDGIWVGQNIVDPAKIEIKYDFENYTISHYVYDRDTIIDTENMIHINYPGNSPLVAIWHDMVLSDTKLVSDIASNDNRQRPDLVVNAPGMPMEELERFTAAMAAKLRGPKNAGSIISTRYRGKDGEKMEFTPLNPPSIDPGDPESLVRKISSAFKYPYAKIMSNEVNRAAATTMINQWLRDLEPYTTLVEDAYNRHVQSEFPEMPDGSILVTESLSVNDTEFDLKETNELFKNKIIDRYQAKMLYGLNPTDDDRGVYFDGVQINAITPTTEE